MIYKNNKRVKSGLRNISFLGCLNNRMQQLPKMAKTVALRLAEKAKEEKSKEGSLQQDRRDQKNIRNKSTNIPSNQQFNKGANPSPTNPNIALMNRSGNGIKRP